MLFKTDKILCKTLKVIVPVKILIEVTASV